MNSNKKQTARVNYPERRQVSMRFVSLDQMLPVDHVARTIVSYVQTLDTSALYEDIEVSSTQAGRTATNPDVLLCLWLLATVEGIGSARELARRCQRDTPYLWICGEVTVNNFTLSAFRTSCGDFLDQLLVDTITSLIDSGIVSYEVVAQDGMRVRASAGKSSFRRAPKLNELHDQTAAHVADLKRQEQQEKSINADKRSEAAVKKAAEQKLARLKKSLEQVEQLAAKKEKRKKGSGQQARCSTTDPEARNMKMANGGYNPAFNVQFATDSASRMIVAVDVTNEGTDGGQLDPMSQALESNYGRVPGKVVTDSAYATKDGVTKVENRGSQVVATVPRIDQLAKHGKNAYQRQKGDTDQYVNYRLRMKEQANIDLCKLRPSVAEFPNAVCRNRGLQQFNVRGLNKARVVAMWHALAFNFTRMLNLQVIQ